MNLYGCDWSHEDPLLVEMEMIRQGGYLRSGDLVFGHGLFFHYRELQRLLWPEGEDHHRWSDQMLEVLLSNRISAFLGARDCVAGWTRILNPLTGESPTIKSLCETNTRPVVMTLHGPKLAGVPFLKGVTRLLEVATEDGNKFTASPGHHVLTESGYQAVSTLRIGQSLLSYEPLLRGTISDIFRSVCHTKVQEIKEVGEGEYFDLTVPVEHHYFAEGTIHHNTGKTHCMARYALTDYYVFPKETLILISSTDLRGLELRVWGDIKSMDRAARERHPSLPGKAVDSQHGIFTDEITDDTPTRDRRRGIICIPCLDRKGNWQGGLEKFVGIKQKRRRVLGDECFIAGTPVDTPTGPVPIEQIQPGDAVLNPIGVDRVVGVKITEANSICRIRLRDGREIICTTNHKFLTHNGWKKACELHQGQYMIGVDEAMQILRQADFQQSVLFGALSESMDDHYVGRAGEIEYARAARQDQHYRPAKDAVRQSHETGFEPRETQLHFEEDGMATEGARRQWYGSDQSRRRTYALVSDGDLAIWDQNRQMEREWLSSGVQGGHRLPLIETGYRSGREYSSQPDPSRYGCQKNRFLTGAWVDSVTSVKPVDFGKRGGNATDVRVYNLHVERHHSYSVMGLVAKNCQFMHREYVTILGNLDKGEFKGVFVGNPIPNLKALDIICEPPEGWESKAEATKTETYLSKFGAMVLNLVGTDSPNFDVPEDQPAPYPYLVDREDEKRVGDRFGRNSENFYVNIKGVRKEGLEAHRVLTRFMCESNGAFGPVTWGDENPTRVYGMDAGYGGDRAVGGYGDFGVDKDGYNVIAFNPPQVIPIQYGMDPEDQISVFVKRDCEAAGIPPQNVFFEAGMRATMATSLAKVFSPLVNAVNFGGPATDRPVAVDEYVIDQISGSKRLLLCYERYIKLVTEFWFAVRLAVLSRQVRQLPQDVAAEFYMREWSLEKGDKYMVEEKAETKKRLGQSPDLADWCFLGDTCVSTPTGPHRIDSLKAGDEVLTPMGITTIHEVRIRPARVLTRAVFSDGTILEGLGDHKLFVFGKGWVRLDSVSIDNEVESVHNLPLWHILNRCFTTANATGFKAQVDIIRATRSTLRRRDFYIESSGKSTTALFLKVIACIIRMGIGQTTGLKIWSWFRRRFMRETTSRRDGKEPLIKQASWQDKRRPLDWLPDGIIPRKAEHGIARTQGDNGDYSASLSGSRAECVTGVSERECPPVPGTVPSVARTDTISAKRPVTLGNVLSAAKALWRTSILRRKLVPRTVEQCWLDKSKPVYNLTLDEHNAYYANGILVSNCVIVMEGARRLGFQIQSVPLGYVSTKEDDNYLAREVKRYQQQLKRRSLHYGA